MRPWNLTGRMTAGKQSHKAAEGNKGDRKNMTVKEKLKQEANAAIENLEQVKKKAEEESRAAETTAAAKETTQLPKRRPKHRRLPTAEQ